MARRPSQQERIDQLTSEWEPELRAAFLASIRDIIDRVRLNTIISALERGDIEAAVSAVHVEAPAFQPLDTAIRQAFVEAGTATAATLPQIREAATGATLVFRFDVRNPAAEQWLTSHSSQSITEIVEDQRAAIRTKLTEGMFAGANPRSTALEVVGRVNPVTARREGGIIGLTSQQERFVAAARAELLSGDPALMRNYLARGRRDARFDAVVRRAIEAKKPVDAATAARLVGRYSDRLLQLRGETIGRTESMASLSAARHLAWQQAAEKGGFSVASVTKAWIATRDKRTRDTHRHLNGKTAGFNERFSNGLLYPGDPAGEAKEIINCRCRLVYRKDHFAGLE